MNPHGCIAYPCEKKRVKKSGFCGRHKKEHNQSAWVKAFRANQGKEQ